MTAPAGELAPPAAKAGVRERLWLYDTTLRDGQQSQGVDFSVDDKAAIASALDGLGIDYVEGGWPGANPTDSAFFAAAPRLTRARLAAFGMTKRSGRSAANDEVLAGVVERRNAGRLPGRQEPRVPRADRARGDARGEPRQHRRVGGARHGSRDARRSSTPSISSTASGRTRAYALDCLRAALDAGARWVVLCDTNGGTLPAEVAAITAAVVAAGIPGERLGIHAHDDTGNAVANTLAAIDAGARQVQGTLNGLGERCGNANLVSLIPTLMLKEPYAGALRDRDRARDAAGADPGQPAARRHPEPGAGPAGALRRGLGLHPQGGAACERDPEGSRRPTSMCRPRRSATPASSRCRTRPGSRTCASGWRGPGSRCRPATRGSARSSPRSRRARTAAMPTTGRRRASSCWRARCSGRCRGSSRSSATG